MRGPSARARNFAAVPAASAKKARTCAGKPCGVGRPSVGAIVAGVAGARQRRQIAPPFDRARKLGVGVVIEIDQPRHGVFARRLDALRRPRHHRRRPAHHQRRHRADREGAAVAAHARFRLEPAERAVEPAGVGAARIGQPAFQHVLPVEMRALAIGRRGRVHDRGLPGLVQPVQVRHRGIEREERSRAAAPASCRRARSALSPRSFTQSGSPTGATAASPSSAPRRMMVSMRGSRPSARASFGRNGQANSTPAAAEQFASCRGMDAS